eukprot:6177572-Pleurochrysis_carterae.AAC.1
MVRIDYLYGGLKPVCHHGAVTYLPILIASVLAGVLLAIGFSMLLCRRISTPHAEDELESCLAKAYSSTDIATRRAMSESDLARELLWQMSPKMRGKRLAHLKSIAKVFGFQRDNVLNQAEHLESLLISHLSREDGNYLVAVDSLHSSLLSGFSAWEAHVLGLRQDASISVAAAEAAANGAASFNDHTTPVGAKPLPFSRRLRAPDIEQQVREVALYLLIWGEASNLRFMPEFLYFIFSVCIDRLQSVQHAPPPVFSQTSAACGVSTRLEASNGGNGNCHAVLRNGSNDTFGHGDDSRSNSDSKLFLVCVVQPVFKLIFNESFTGLVNGRPQPRAEPVGVSKYTRNYDDWNERFWTMVSLRKLTTKGGFRLMDAMPKDR